LQNQVHFLKMGASQSTSQMITLQSQVTQVHCITKSSTFLKTSALQSTLQRCSFLKDECIALQ
jgi:hypothetical protein